MIDGVLREAKDRALAPVVHRLAGRVSPAVLTALSLLGGLGGGGAAAGLRWWAVAIWLVGRVADGLDGAVARSNGRQSDLGGYLDMMADTLGYSAVPLGIAIAQDRPSVWAACAVLLASFYVNTMSWTYLAAVAEKRGTGATAQHERTTVHMPTGLVEGTETIAFFVLMLAWPSAAPVLFSAMAALVALTIGQRVVWAVRHLR